MTPWSPIRWAAIRGGLARSSSAASGFFFWGMIEEPEAHASETSQHPNSSLDHRTISAPRRERWVAQVAAAAGRLRPCAGSDGVRGLSPLQRDVNVRVAVRERERAGAQLRLDLVERLVQRVAFRVREDPLGREHSLVVPGDLDIVETQPPVEH